MHLISEMAWHKNPTLFWVTCEQDSHKGGAAPEVSLASKRLISTQHSTQSLINSQGEKCMSQQGQKSLLEGTITGVPFQDQSPRCISMDGCAQCASEVKRSPKGENSIFWCFKDFSWYWHLGIPYQAPNWYQRKGSRNISRRFPRAPRLYKRNRKWESF